MTGSPTHVMSCSVCDARREVTVDDRAGGDLTSFLEAHEHPEHGSRSFMTLAQTGPASARATQAAQA